MNGLLVGVEAAFDRFWILDYDTALSHATVQTQNFTNASDIDTTI